MDEPHLISKCDGQRIFLRRGDDSAAADKEDQPDADTAITAMTIRNKAISAGCSFVVAATKLLKILVVLPRQGRSCALEM
jgi:hypothetical protein